MMTPPDRSSPTLLRGSVLASFQFDVCEEIRFDLLQQIVDAHPVAQPTLRYPTPGYIRYERPPLVETIEIVLESGEKIHGQIKYYDYGVLSVVFRLPFEGDWETLIHLAGRSVWDTNFDGHADRIVREKLERAASTLVKPYPEKLTEDYFIYHVHEIAGSPSADQLIHLNGPQITQIVRGDTAPLAESECHEVLQSRISYYPNDVVVIGWNAAFIYDSVQDAETAIQLLEYANSQLLQFRHYDALLSRELDRVYKSFENRTGAWARWRLARSATGLHTVMLDVMELSEHAENAIKFLSDTFSARLYKLAASKIGVPDYKTLVTQKMHTAEDLYQFMVGQFTQSRGFILEVTVVVILVIELFRTFR